MKRVALFSALLLLAALCAVGAAVWLARGRTGEVLLSPDELRVLGAVVADSGSHILPPHDVFSIVFNSQTLVKLKMCMVY